MIDGIILGAITWLSLVLTFTHLPQLMKRFLLNHFIISDILATGITFFFLSSISHSITSVAGSIVCGLLVNFTLVLNKKIGDHSNETVKQTVS